MTSALAFHRHHEWKEVYSFYEDVCDEFDAGRMSSFDPTKLYVRFQQDYGGPPAARRATPATPVAPGTPSAPLKNPRTPKQKTCHFYNSLKDGVSCTRQKCTFPHTCSLCGDAHPRKDCPKKQG